MAPVQLLPPPVRVLQRLPPKHVVRDADPYQDHGLERNQDPEPQPLACRHRVAGIRQVSKGQGQVGGRGQLGPVRGAGPTRGVELVSWVQPGGLSWFISVM